MRLMVPGLGFAEGLDDVGLSLNLYICFFAFLKVVFNIKRGKKTYSS